ncbi:MAG: universal stress protein [Geminicoccaceae bacterium]
MLTRIVAFIDGSAYAQSVCDHAAWAAIRLGGPVEVVHVLGRRDVASAPADLSGNLDANTQETLLSELAALDAQKARLALKRGRLILDEAKQRLQSAGVADVTTRLRHGDLIDTVVELEHEARFLCLGKRGEGADFARLHLGSNLERVARASSRPILVAARAFKPIERFLIAFDGGASSLKAVDHVAASPVLRGLACHLLMVGPDSADAERRLVAATSRLEAGGLSVRAEILPGEPDKVIARTVEQERIGLLVMGAYGHSRIRSLVIGSTTTAMIRSCLVPIFMFR